MAKGVTIQWCASCKAWTPSKLLGRQILQGSANVGAPEAFHFDYARNHSQCGGCQSDVVTAKMINCASDKLWHGHMALSKLMKALAPRAA
jgi:hypothetical protein